MFVIEVRKPKYTLIQKFKKWWFGYSRKYEKWQNSLPNNGDYIKFTWLSNPVNNPLDKSIWIGVSGEVFDMNKEDGSFCLKLKSGATLVHPPDDFNYIKLVK